MTRSATTAGCTSPLTSAATTPGWSNSRNHAQAGIEGWLADYPSPINFLDVLLSCRSFVPASTANFNNPEFCDPGFDRVVHRAEDLQDTDPVRSIELWHEADRIAVDQAPWVPLTNLSART